MERRRMIEDLGRRRIKMCKKKDNKGGYGEEEDKDVWKGR